MLWVTRPQVMVDRVASAWLIRRFVDNDADFMFAPESEIPKISSERNAIAFDTSGAYLGHYDGQCSFQAILKSYGLDKNKALAFMGEIINAADNHDDLPTGNLRPISHGLKAIAYGFSLRAEGDRYNIDSQMGVYDALYAWCRVNAH